MSKKIILHPWIVSSRRSSWVHTTTLCFGWELRKIIFIYTLLSGDLNTPIAVGNVSGYRCETDCRSRGRKFDPGRVQYFRGDWSWNNFYGHSPFSWIIHEGLLSVTSRVVLSYKRKYVHKLLVYCLFKLAQKKSVVRWTDSPTMTIAVDLGRKATKQTKKNTRIRKINPEDFRLITLTGSQGSHNVWKQIKGQTKN